jgi:predicted nuclease of restriction endonuclease-like (RecB) superfamily
VFVVPSDLEGQSLALLDAMGGELGVGASEVAENKEEIVEQQIWRIACCF